MTGCNALACTKRTSWYIQEHKTKSRALAVDRKFQTKNHWDILYVHIQLHVLKRRLSKAVAGLCSGFFTSIFQEKYQKKKTTTKKQTSICTVNKTKSKSKGTKFKKGNRFLTYFKPIFPLAPEEILGVEKGNIGSQSVLNFWLIQYSIYLFKKCM